MTTVIMRDSLSRFGPPTWVDLAWNGNVVECFRSAELFICALYEEVQCGQDLYSGLVATGQIGAGEHG